jgi:DNA-binding NarL/FixJ family response regulator
MSGVTGVLLASLQGIDTALRWRAVRVPWSTLPLLALGGAAVTGFPLDELWHRAFGVDVTMWSPTHMLMILGAAFVGVAAWLVLADAGVKPRDSRWAFGIHVVAAWLTLQGLIAPLGEFSFGVPQFQQIFHPLILAIASGFAFVAIRLVLADDHPVVLHGLQRLFERYDEFQVLGTCATGSEALDAVQQLQPDVLVLDLRLPDRTGIEVLRTMAERKVSCRTVLLTAAIDDRQAVEVVRLGAKGIVLKESSPDALLECVRRVHRGEEWIEQEVLAGAFGHVVRGDAAIREANRNLTPRETEIVRMVVQGLRNRVVAERLSISEGTVKIHLHHIYEKLGIDGRLELVLWAQEHGVI